MVRQVRRSPEIEDAILDRLAGGESLRRICDDADMPHVRNVLRWVIDDAEFATKYARARQAQAELLVDEMQEIADNGRNDWMEANGQDAAGWRANGEAVARSKLRL
jgi:hypothetical protein